MKFQPLFILLFFISTSFISASAVAAEHTVKMLNNSADGVMAFEPGIIRVAVGDTVHFEPSDAGHNAELIAGFAPAGAESWKGELGKKISVTFDKEGVYVYQCLPHAIMAMMGVVVVGNPVNLEDIKAKASGLNAKFVMNKDRLDKYLAQIQ